jgi:hypothetical protein
MRASTSRPFGLNAIRLCSQTDECCGIRCHVQYDRGAANGNQVKGTTDDCNDDTTHCDFETDFHTVSLRQSGQVTQSQQYTATSALINRRI